MQTKPRGVRNNNPLNIRVGNNWDGEAAISRDAEFETFTHHKYGFRAAAKLLRNYQRLYGLDNLTDIIHRFAPPNENHTTNYIDFVASQTGVGAQSTIDLTDDALLARVLHAMSIMEVGRYYSVDDALAGVQLA
ncbi:structural protein [Vibrio sp. SM6]|uniref:Structural protein n=1 Tax=Vibrio agarilyticus TaxID=2726741 RepID=A0A7X8TRM7_9VIBR|nr:structural protein [Vibrio agarilyticus]NLS13366.1 structural protein [Vibrio agarilyticus]